MRILSWNLLHSVGAEPAHVEALAAATEPDLLLMQEATAAMDVLPARLGGHYARAALPGRAHGLAAWSRMPFQSPARSLVLQRGLVVRRIAQILDLGELCIANVHLSHGQMLNRRQLRRIAGILPGKAAILGDCNMVGAGFVPGFKDVGGAKATHRMSGWVPLRLDRCFVRGVACESIEVLPRGASDHCPLLVVLNG